MKSGLGSASPAHSGFVKSAIVNGETHGDVILEHGLMGLESESSSVSKWLRNSELREFVQISLGYEIR